MKGSNVYRVIGIVIVVALTAAFLFRVWPVILPFIVGLVVAYLIHPVVDRFASHGYRRDRVVFFLYFFLLGVGGFMVSWFFPAVLREAHEFLAEVPKYTATVNQMIDNGNGEMRMFFDKAFGKGVIQAQIPFRADQVMEGLFINLPEKLVNVAHIGMWILIVPFTCFFGLSHGRRWIDFIFQNTPADSVEGLLGMLAELNATLGSFVRGVVAESTIVGLMTAGGLALLGVNGALLIGVLCGLVNFVPFMAVILGGALALLAAYFQGHTVGVVFGIVVLFLVIRLVDDFVLIPFVVGRSVQLHPVLVLFSVLAGVELAGFLGLIFALPIAVVIKVSLTITLRNRREQLLLDQQHVYS